MISKRIIPCLDIRDGRVVKGVNFEGVRDVSDPVALAEFYNKSGADELVFYDITASFEKRALFTEVLKKVASEIFIPLTVGGGVNEISDFDRLRHSGADKVSVNSGAVKNPQLMTDAAKKYGAQCVVLSIDAKRVDGKFKVCRLGGREVTDIDAIEWARQGELLGAGEIVLNSIDTDGVKSGFDLDMLEQVCSVVNIPVIASGGAGCIDDFYELFTKVPKVDAGLAASIFHFKTVDIADLKSNLANRGIGMRIVNSK